MSYKKKKRHNLTQVAKCFTNGETITEFEIEINNRFQVLQNRKNDLENMKCKLMAIIKETVCTQKKPEIAKGNT